jgi:polyhydroxybutyrate depolymerase
VTGAAAHRDNALVGRDRSGGLERLGGGQRITGEPTVTRLPGADGDPPVVWLTWSAPDCPPVVLYQIEGGGHGWPGGPQYLPARVIGRVPRHLDASEILLDMVTAG